MPFADLDSLHLTRHFEVTAIVVSYNTRELTLRAIETLLQNRGAVRLSVVVFDNASSDGSAEAVADAFPDVLVISSTENIGFARANNLVAASVQSEYLLLINPDTETYPDAVDRLLAFLKECPDRGIVGGRTYYPDGTLNPFSCLGRMTLRSLVFRTFGLSILFPKSTFFNPELIGGWQRDTVREVDIVVGCFLLISAALWRRLGGFDPRFFMYGEDADLCLRAKALGYRPAITPDAGIMHIVGASAPKRADKLAYRLQAEVTLISLHWARWQRPLGRLALRAYALSRMVCARLMPNPTPRRLWDEVWLRRNQWLTEFAPVPRQTPREL